MLSKAKRIDTGEWVTGDLFNATSGMTIIENGGSDPKDFHFVKPETLCEQVRGTEFFEGDEVTDGDLTGFIYFCETHLQYKVNLGKIKMYLHFPNWKPTGKNQHDDE